MDRSGLHGYAFPANLQPATGLGVSNIIRSLQQSSPIERIRFLYLYYLMLQPYIQLYGSPQRVSSWSRSSPECNESSLLRGNVRSSRPATSDSAEGLAFFKCSPTVLQTVTPLQVSEAARVSDLSTVTTLLSDGQQSPDDRGCAKWRRSCSIRASGQRRRD
jgi:hypothetical protein